ncbi:hypothetical protein F4808DRAFT_461794 [Astrocystis sublimbata]|nr:hypothetical protein F4808DRAFT_461794 [Astrocystis sublimbata]
MANTTSSSSSSDATSNYTYSSSTLTSTSTSISTPSYTYPSELNISSSFSSSSSRPLMSYSAPFTSNWQRELGNTNNNSSGYQAQDSWSTRGNAGSYTSK